MTDGSVLLFPAGPDLVGQVVKDITHGPAHVAICVGGLVFDDTIWHQPGRWLPVSGVEIMLEAFARGRLNFTVRDPATPFTPAEAVSSLAAAVDQVNLRRRYNIPLLLADAVIYPTRRFWDWLGWVPFEGAKEYVCSSFAAMVYRASGRDPWPGEKTEEIVPEDFAGNPEWRDEA